MNADAFEAHFNSVREMLDNAASVKGVPFVKFVKFNGLLQGFFTTTLSMVAKDLNEEKLEIMSENMTCLAAAVCSEYAEALKLSSNDVVEALELVDRINTKFEKMH